MGSHFKCFVYANTFQVNFALCCLQNTTTVYNDRLTAFDPGQPG